MHFANQQLVSHAHARRARAARSSLLRRDGGICGMRSQAQYGKQHVHAWGLPAVLPGTCDDRRHQRDRTEARHLLVSISRVIGVFQPPHRPQESWGEPKKKGKRAQRTGMTSPAAARAPRPCC